MWSLGIDQHERQITISIRNEIGDVLWARQVSTQPEKIQAFFQQLTQDRLQAGEEFVAILEVCGFNEPLGNESPASRPGTPRAALSRPGESDRPAVCCQ